MAFTLFGKLTYRNTDISDAKDSDNPEEFAKDGTVCPADEATLITSKISDGLGHAVLLDIDCPNAAIPSATDGHLHLYFQPPQPISWGDYAKFLEAAAKIGILNKGYVEASKERGYTALRVPWAPKEIEENHAISEESIQTIREVLINQEASLRPWQDISDSTATGKVVHTQLARIGTALAELSEREGK